MPEPNVSTGETYSPSGWSQDDPSQAPPGSTTPGTRSGASPLAQQSPLSPDQKVTADLGIAKASAEQPYQEKVLKMLNEPAAATAHLEKVKDEPKPQDYKKYSFEFASAMAVLGAISGRWTRHAGNASLNAFAAALNGWQKGNLEAYSQATQQWEEATKKTIENNRVELEKYKAIMADKQANIDQMMAAMQLAGAESQNKVIMDLAASKNFTGVFSAVDKMENQNGRLSKAVEQLTGLRNESSEMLAAKVNDVNNNPQIIATMKPSDFQNLRAAAEVMHKHDPSFPLVNQQPMDTSFVQSAVDEVGQYKANPTTVLSRMPAQYRSMFWDQLRSQYPDWSQQTFNAGNAGATSGARTEANRAANLDIILNSAKAAVPQAIAAGDALPRGQWVPVNRAIQAVQAGESNPQLKAFAIANLQLAELWARAMNPTGVMRTSDREIALSMLSTADSPQAYKAAVDAVLQAINREKGAVLQTEQERGARTNPNPDAGSLTPAPPSSGNDGWGEVKVH
jgi:hypothetical protein